jgi:hypothetical protein
MPNIGRRGALKFLGGSALAIGSIDSVSAAIPDERTADHGPTPDSAMPGVGTIHKLGHTLGSDPAGGYAEEDVRSDGQYAVVSSFFGIGGSFLFDIRNPTNPTQVHNLPSEKTVRNADCAFDPMRDGLYYRSQEPNTGGADLDGVEVVDYGFDFGSRDSPIIISKIPSGSTHNLFPHPTEPLLYTTDEEVSFEIWDVADPFEPEMVGEGPPGDAHDFVIDPERDVMHFAGHVEIEDAEAAAYVTMDVSNPRSPSVIGYIDYGDFPNLQETGFSDEIVFDAHGGHYANYDPDRMIAVISDETGGGFPAPKTTVDIGWGEGSLQNPIPLDQQWVPNAELQNEPGEAFDWTTHNHDIISKDDETLVVSGDYHEGTLLYNISDPENIQVADQYYTDDMADQARGPTFFPPQDSAPMAWGANYNEERDLAVTSDMFTGLYVYTVVPS